jgi:hypothetical protein
MKKPRWPLRNLEGLGSARSGLSWGIVVLQCSFPLAVIHAPRSILVGEMTAVRIKRSLAKLMVQK